MLVYPFVLREDAIDASEFCSRQRLQLLRQHPGDDELP